ncbi:calcium/calmodulin-dependent protein kinase kinase [[Emmonsia] crescens]|uniref:Calcium/calmodulin-dependent protein kinase kinase n=1 Tax=[Emmonsia] crescens TaxID=73230 RepID=A0A0G2J231_9EURO|nr:calcium/calmodulin-dependent protein kinase kinase [Emmonsia crescens UAMH 3008]
MAQDSYSFEHQHTAAGKITIDCSTAVTGTCTARSTTASYNSPLRHHTRSHTAPRRVKETLNARSEYTNSQDDGAAEHRINQYLIKQEIGRGSFGAVHLAVDQYGQEYAVKEFSKSRLRKRAQSHILRNPRGARRPGIIAAGVGLNSPLHRHPSGHEDEEGGNPLYLIKEEIAIMKKLNHPNLVALFEVLDDPTEDSLYMVMEMCKKGVIMKVGLGEFSDPYDNESCRCWFRDLILGVEYLHAQNVVHRDIKPDNCLLTSDDVLKVVDFGVSEMFQKDSDMYTAKSAGSPAFLPPELCVAKHGDILGTAADIWSMGVTLYCLRYGRIPFEQESIFELYESIRNDEVKYENETNEDFIDLMTKILEKDPAKRIKMPELRNHPWVTKGGADPLLSAEENTANLIGDPTEEEVNTAITSKIGNVLTVIRAVQKFKRLIEPENATPMQSILGQDVEPHFVQPPLSMDASDVELPSDNTTDQNALSSARSIHSKSGSTDSGRRVVEKGIHTYPTMQESGSASRLASTHGESCSGTCQHSAASTTKSPCPTPLQTSRTNTPSKQSFSEGTRGHARDPLEEDHSFLFIGPSTFTGVLTLEDEKTSSNYFSRAVAPHATTVPTGSSGVLDDDSGGFSISEMDLVPIVSESPGASDIDIYETAYTEEVERIRKQSLTRQRPAPRVYLTRRVEGKESSLGELLRRATADVTAAVAADKKGPSSGLAQIVAVISSTTTTTTTAAAAIPPAQNQEIATLDKITQVSMAATTTGPSTVLASQIQSQDAEASADAGPKAELEATITTVFTEPTVMQGSEQQPAQDPDPSPTSSTPSLSHKTSGAGVAVTGTTNATAATETTPTTQRSRTSLRSLLGRVRRESTQFGKK